MVYKSRKSPLSRRRKNSKKRSGKRAFSGYRKSSKKRSGKRPLSKKRNSSKKRSGKRSLQGYRKSYSKHKMRGGSDDDDAVSIVSAGSDDSGTAGLMAFMEATRRFAEAQRAAEEAQVENTVSEQINTEEPLLPKSVKAPQGLGVKSTGLEEPLLPKSVSTAPKGVGVKPTDSGKQGQGQANVFPEPVLPVNVYTEPQGLEITFNEESRY